MFSKLFGNFIAFVYHCFDRIVIHGYLSGLSRPEQVVHFFRRIVGVPVVSKEILSERTANYQNWVEAFARNHRVPIEWAEKGVRKEDYVLRWLRRMIRTNRYGVYFIFKSMEQGTTFRISVPKYPTADPNYRILAHQRSRFTHYYFYIRDEVLGPMVMRVASFFPFQTTYYLNGHSSSSRELNRAQVGFRKHDNAFLAIDDVAALQAAADRLSPPIIRKRLDYWTFLLGPKFSPRSESRSTCRASMPSRRSSTAATSSSSATFPSTSCSSAAANSACAAHRRQDCRSGTRLHRRMRGKLATIIDQIEHGHHVFAPTQHAFLKQYEKLSTFLRNELCSNNLADFGLRKPWTISMRFARPFKPSPAASPATRLSGSTSTLTFPCCSASRPYHHRSVRYPGIKIHDVRVIRLCEVLLHSGTHVDGWTAKQIHQAVLTTFRLSDRNYGLNQLRYDLRKLKGHGLLERDGSRYAYRLTAKGVQVALLFLFFHKRLCGPIANSCFHNRPDPHHRPDSRLEAAYHRADKAIQNIVDVLAAA